MGTLKTRNAQVAAGVLLLRIGYGLALLVKPMSLTERWLGEGRRLGSTQVALRGLGGREVVLHIGALLAVSRGAPLRPWLGASMACDLTDVIATVAARRELPPSSAPATVAVGGGAALLSAGIALAAEH
jgi:hypothetical protein